MRAGLDFNTLNTNIEKLVKSALAIDGHFEYINYPEGQHVFGIVDTPIARKRSSNIRLRF